MGFFLLHTDRSHALRGNASCDALRHGFGTRSVPGCIPTQSVGTIISGCELFTAALAE
jgi:hypothetical protein